MSIGIGIVTYQRENQINQVLTAIPKNVADHFVVVNDSSEPYNSEVYPEYYHVIQNEKNSGVGISKNKALKYLMDKNCDYLFLIEDDMLIKDPIVFEKYISLSKVSGIEHFNAGFHGPANKVNGRLAPKFVVEYDKDNILSIYKHCVGSFSFFTRRIIEDDGYMDEHFVNAWEHPEESYRFIKKGYHPPFWNFADIANSDKYIGEIGSVDTTSVIRKDEKWQQQLRDGRAYFRTKHGCDILEIPDVSQSYVYKWLEKKQKEASGTKTEQGLYLKEKADLTDCTFMIPFNIDSEDRKTNLKLLIDYLNKNYKTNILVAEQNTEWGWLQEAVKKGLCQRIAVDTGSEKLNYKTKLMNELLKASTTPIVIQQDVDCFVAPEQLLSAVESIRKGKSKFYIPFSGTCFNVHKNKFVDFFNNILDHSAMDLYSTSSRGGIFCFKTDTLIHCGGFNEDFKGWSYEDDEIFIRINKLGYIIERTTGSLYHLDHERNQNSSGTNPYYAFNQSEVVRISKLSKEELLEEIENQDWL